MDDQIQSTSFMRTLRLKVKSEAYPWLNKAAVEVNATWNWANETSHKAARPFAGKAKWLSGFDLNNLSAGATECFDRIGAGTVQLINQQFASKRRQFKKDKLRWRVSRGVRKSLGWLPFKAASIKRNGSALRFCGKTFRVFESNLLDGLKWKQGCFTEDSCGDWWLCLPVEYPTEQSVAPREAVGIDLGIKTIATTSDGDTLEAGRWTQRTAKKLAMAQRRGHKKQAKRIHRRLARQRKDALHKFSRKIVDRYQTIVVGDVSSTKMVKTRMAKSVLDSGWGMLKNFLEYKSQQAARSFAVVNEKYTSVTCSSCGSRSGPSGVSGLIVRSWKCCECGDLHDRDVNAARNILTAARWSPSVRGNEFSSSLNPLSRLRKSRSKACGRNSEDGGMSTVGCGS